MSAYVLDGTALSKKLLAEISEEVGEMQQAYGVSPGLAAVLVGDDPASEMYVQMKRKRSERVGMASIICDFPADITQAELTEAIEDLNHDERVHGILLQLPLPDHLDNAKAIEAIALEKDVDGLHPSNMGRLAMRGLTPGFVAATPYGCMVLLEEAERVLENFQIAGSDALVIGHSNIVGVPMALSLIEARATVTIAHSSTADLAEKISQADIVVSAVGQPKFIRGDWFKPGAIAIDVATVKVDDSSTEKGYRWVGDFEYEAAKEYVAAITPVPGGVGPMTIAMLLRNTLTAAQRALGERTTEAV